jgi:nitrite reductase/ring-hydroxylating ferredoxin subunit
MSTIAPTDIAAGTRQWPRRTVLASSGAALLACAACSSGSTATAGSTSTPSAASSAPASSSASGGGAALASVADIPADTGLIVSGPDGKVLLAKSGATVVAHKAVCTHQGAILDGAGTCPLHGSKFDIKTGAVLNGPATTPLAAVSVTESDGKVFSA